MPLLTLPISDFVGLISLQVGLFVKFGLWSLSVMNASLLAVVSTLSSIPNFVAMSLFTVQQLKQKMQPLPKGKISNHLPTETFYTEQT